MKDFLTQVVVGIMLAAAALGFLTWLANNNANAVENAAKTCELKGAVAVRTYESVKPICIKKEAIAP